MHGFATFFFSLPTLFFPVSTMPQGATSVIVVLERDSTDIENKGKIINFGDGASVDTVRNLAMDKLGISTIPANDVVLLDGSGKPIDTMDQMRQQQVVRVDVKEHIKDVIPGPTKYPFVGSIRELLPNMYVYLSTMYHHHLLTRWK